MVDFSGTILFTLKILGIFSVCTADITDMTGEAICAAQCLSNFTLSLDESEQSFLNQRPDLTEPHCLSKRSNCSLCLEVCRWPRQNISSCESACNNLRDSNLKMLLNSPIEMHRKTCLEACIFSHTNRLERAAVVDGRRPASCPLPSSWPDSSTCQPTQRCTTDADCDQSTLAKCCRLDACLADQQMSPPAPLPPSMLYRLARGGAPSTQSRTLSPPGFCMRISNDTAFAYRGVPPVPGRPSVRQTAMAPGELEVYKLELDWLDYYNNNRSTTNIQEWTSPAVFLVQVRLFRDLEASLFADEGEFGDEILQEELFSEWRSLVWTTKVGAVLSDLSPGTWYQFRLKATSGTGFGGNGRPSRPIKVMSLPEAPMNLTESNSRIYSNKVEIKLQWEPPTYGNAPIKFYRVSWKKNVPPHMDDNSLGEYEVKVPKAILTYTLQDLEPSTVYKVHVTAVAVVDGREWSSPPVMRFIKTMQIPSKKYTHGGFNYHNNIEGGSCRCGDSTENPNLILSAFFEAESLKTHLAIPSHFLTQYFGPNVKDTTIFHLLWYPQVCIENQNSKAGLSNAPAVISVYTAALAGMDLEGLRFQCHYKLQIRISENALQLSPKKSLDLCFCTPSCSEVVVKSGLGPRNCSFSDILIPLRPVDVGYRLFPTEANHRRPIASGGVVASSKSETEPVFPVRSGFSDKSHGFDALIFWKPHPEMVVATGGVGRYTKFSDPFPEARRQSRGYRVIWGPRLVEPIELDMYSNGIAPQLDPERTESKVVDLKVHNVILRNLEPNTLYIVQVQTIGVHGDSPVNVVFFSTPDLRKYSDIDSSRSLRNSWIVYVYLTLLCLFDHNFSFW